MRRQWKRNAVVATVLLFVCAAVYLNWRYAGEAADYPWRFLLRGSRYISAPPKGWEIFR